MLEILESLFAPEYRDRAYRITFRDGERYVLRAVGCFGGGDDPDGAAGTVVQAVVRRVEAEPYFQPGKAMSFPLSSVREVADERTGELLYRAV